MSDERMDDSSLAAAELALGLLHGGDLAAAQRRVAQDSAFAREVEQWQARLTPLADALEPQAPPPQLWNRIAGAIGPVPAANDNHALGRKLRLWRLYGAGVTALAASLAVVIGLRSTAPAPAPAPPPIAQTAPQVLIATLASTGLPNSVSVAYDRGQSSLLVTPGRWPSDAAHDHQLWIIPPGGQPVPIGICCERGVERHSIPRELAPHFRARSTIAVSIEPVGGNRTGRPSSDFAVTGQLQPI